ncbi:response regulator [Paraburkholderia sp. MMS20-SJTR3]|uniref:histidine kinase n=1 Tax=Paraburkholderia sejongensis TaxID=2886946 RepID=A0ABS8K0P7_9BURK|nr:response regulator [Paraburkholderia sp. MMS20-SJTR3]MCC8395737.1 response regulator [Paraburkholderia sp. MMS20-SJTR3]
MLGHARHRPYDGAHARFVETLVQQIAAGLGNARAKELERERSDRLATLDRARNEFFANVSHEFRTPLTLLLAPLEALSRERGALPRHVEADLDAAVRSARRLLRMVNSLLDFSQIDVRGRKALVVQTDLGLLTVDIASAFRSAIEAAGLALHVDIAPTLPAVPVNSGMWEQIVSNLLANALKFTFKGSITVRVKALRLHAELEVSDTGIGIPTGEMQNIFKRFHRVRGSQARTSEGAGIGLALVHDLVHRMGGQLTVRSIEGEGSTFTVWLPLNAQPLRTEVVDGDGQPSQPLLATDLATEAARWLAQPDAPLSDVVEDLLDPPVPEASRLAGGHLLIVDDNADLRAYLRRLLAGRWGVTLAANGAQALALAREQVPDLVLTDVMMPALDGFELLQQIREDPRLAHVPVVLLTARAGEEAGIEGLRAGADDYIAKPFSPRELIARLQAALERARADAALRDSEAKYRRLIESMDEACTVVEVMRDARGDWADFLFIQANPAFVRQTGMPFPVGKTATQLLGTPNPRWAELYGQAIDSGQPLRVEESEGTLGRTFDLNIFSVDTAQNRVAVIFADITERKRAERALRESEEKYRQLFERIDEGFCIFEMIFEAEKPVDYRFIDVNPTFERHTGIVDAKGRRMREIAPDHEQYWFDRYGQVALTGQAQRFEASAKALGDRWYEVHAFRIGEPAQRRVAVVFSDISQRRRSAAALRASEVRTRRQNEALQLAARGAPLEKSLNVVAEMVVAETAGQARTAFYIADREGKYLHPVRSAGNMPDAYLDMVDGFVIGEDSLACGLAVPTGQPVLTRDVLEEPRWAAWTHIALAHDYRGCWSFPIKTREHQAVGTLAMYFRAPREATPDDLAFADIVTQTAAVIIAGHQDKQERERAEETLRQSEAKYRA